MQLCSTVNKRDSFIRPRYTANLQNLISLCSNRLVLHTNKINNCQDNNQHLPIPVRITSRHAEHSPNVIYNTRNSSNLININNVKNTSDCVPRLRFAAWNAHSLNKKAASVCDLVISKRKPGCLLTITLILF